MAGHDYKTAFVTGASSGIGEALVRQLARAGIRVALAARRESELQRLAQEIEDAGGQAAVYPLDVSDPQATIATVTRADEELGGLDLVIANAGVGRARWSGKLQWSDCAPIIDVNVQGAVATLIAVLPRFVERRRGHIVGVSSLAQYRGLPRNAVYSASKAFLSTFLEAVRIDVARSGVHVTDVRPGYVKTPLTADNHNMPMAIEASRAAEEIWDAIVARKAVHAFPLPMATVVRSLVGLPRGLYDPMIRRITGG